MKEPKKGQVVFYMNNPAVVLRIISEDLTELKVSPEFADNMDGSQWCTQCMVGGGDTPQSHTCEEYQDVIDHVNEASTSIITIAENRLINEYPLEVGRIKSLQIEMGKLELRNKAAGAAFMEVKTEESQLKITLKRIEDEIRKSENALNHKLGELEKLKERIQSKREKLELIENKIAIGGLCISMNPHQMRTVVSGYLLNEKTGFNLSEEESIQLDKDVDNFLGQYKITGTV